MSAVIDSTIDLRVPGYLAVPECPQMAVLRLGSARFGPALHAPLDMGHAAVKSSTGATRTESTKEALRSGDCNHRFLDLRDGIVTDLV